VLNLNRPTRRTHFSQILPAGKKEQSPPPCSYSPVIHSFFPKQFVFSAVAQLAAGVLLPGGKAATVPVWSWVNFGERSMIISRAPKPEFAFHIGIRLGRRLPLGLAQFLDQPEASEGTETGSEAADHRRQWATVYREDFEIPI